MCVCKHCEMVKVKRNVRIIVDRRRDVGKLVCRATLNGHSQQSLRTPIKNLFYCSLSCCSAFFLRFFPFYFVLFPLLSDVRFIFTFDHINASTIFVAYSLLRSIGVAVVVAFFRLLALLCVYMTLPKHRFWDKENVM